MLLPPLTLLALLAVAFDFAAAAPHVKRVSDARMTYYEAGLGACGDTNTDSDFIVALNVEDWNGGAHCFEKIEISYNGKSTTATIMDMCPGCPEGALDLTPGLFQFLSGDLGLGVIQGEWHYEDANGAVSSTPSTSTPPPSTSTPPPSTSTPPPSTSTPPPSTTPSTPTTTHKTALTTTTKLGTSTSESSSAATNSPAQIELLFSLFNEMIAMIEES